MDAEVPDRNRRALTILTAVSSADAHLLSAAAESLLKQTMPDWEWVICEDGPTETARVMREVDPRITWVNTCKSGGPAHARNLASAYATGRWFRNLDADDHLPDEHVLARLLNIIEAHPDIRFLLGRAIDQHEDGTTRHWPVPLPYGRLQPGALFDYWRTYQRHVIHPTTLMVEADTFFAYGGYGGLASSEDTALIMRLAQGEPGYLADLDVTIYAKRGTSITAQDWHRDGDDKARRHAFISRCADAVAARSEAAHR